MSVAVKCEGPAYTALKLTMILVLIGFTIGVPGAFTWLLCAQQRSVRPQQAGSAVAFLHGTSRSCLLSRFIELATTEAYRPAHVYFEP